MSFLEHEVQACLKFAIEKYPRFPTIAEFYEIAATLGFNKKSTWKYFTVEDCMTCGGVGFHWVAQHHPGQAKKTGVVACDDCSAGKNIQIAPKPHINRTMRQCRDVEYLGPGTTDFSILANCNA